MRGIWNVAPAFLFFTLLVVLVAFTWSALSPLAISLQDVDPAWQHIEVGSIYNFRDAIYIKQVELTLVCGERRIDLPLLLMTEREPGQLTSLILSRGELRAVFEYAEARAVGFSLASAPIYKLDRRVVTATGLENWREGPIYGAPVVIEVVKVDREVWVFEREQTCELKFENRLVAKFKTYIVEIYIREAAIK